MTAIFTKLGADGKLREIFHTGVASGRARFMVKVGGKEVATGCLLPINRDLFSHKNAPKGVTHLIGAFCLNAEDGATVAEIVAPLDAAVKAGIDERAEAIAETHWSKIEAAGISRAEAETLLDRWGRDGLQIERAHQAEAMTDHAILLRMEFATR